jgi:hypothetical protein
MRFPAAPWSISLQLLTLFSLVVLGTVAFGAFVVVPTPSGFTHHVGVGVALIPILVLIGSVFFVVRGYTVEAGELFVQRLVTATRIPLDGLTKAWADPLACRGSTRLFGIGGLFSFSGLFSNRRLGRYHLYATDFKNAVVLQFRGRTVVITPADPQGFLRHLQMVVPGVQIEAEDLSA